MRKQLARASACLEACKLLRQVNRNALVQEVWRWQKCTVASCACWCTRACLQKQFPCDTCS